MYESCRRRACFKSARTHLLFRVAWALLASGNAMLVRNILTYCVSYTCREYMFAVSTSTLCTPSPSHYKATHFDRCNLLVNVAGAGKGLGMRKSTELCFQLVGNSKGNPTLYSSITPWISSNPYSSSTASKIWSNSSPGIPLSIKSNFNFSIFAPSCPKQVRRSDIWLC